MSGSNDVDYLAKLSSLSLKLDFQSEIELMHE